MYERDDATEPPQPPLDHSFFRLSVGLKKDKSDTPEPRHRAAVEFPAATMSTISPTDFDSVEIQQQYNDINNRWDIAAETEWDNENSSARLFERSRIKALAASFQQVALYDCVQ
ncbi:hypothetical protein Q8A67_004045 [Cirrhinus molitorella]|uniref:Uncharacterized protein n=1 Tax=Cirrhinus molitorella TaxID=172907 RepID=A0AA88TYF3_9TELE|nr:hypothetical protein Q8A67_004045 [Cirrhinus molitorella]